MLTSTGANGPQPARPCPVCEGAGRWHREGSTCRSDGCPADHVRCPICEGAGAMPAWLPR